MDVTFDQIAEALKSHGLSIDSVLADTELHVLITELLGDQDELDQKADAIISVLKNGQGQVSVSHFLSWVFEEEDGAAGLSEEERKHPLEGTWIYYGGEFQLTAVGDGYAYKERLPVREEDDPESTEEGILRQEGAWHQGSTFLGQRYLQEMRVKVSNEGNCLMFHTRDRGGAWPGLGQARFANRKGCLAKGAHLLTVDSTRITERRELKGTVPFKTRLIAAGAPYWDHGAMMVPISPSGAVWCGNVHLAETFSPEVSAMRPDSPASAENGQKLLEDDALWKSLGGGQVVLIKGSWILQYAQRTGRGLPMRQQLPQEAIWEKDTLKSLQELGKVKLVAVSYCWHTPDHPDPEGFSLAILAQAISTRLTDRHMPVDDLALFVDWCSLYQKPRTYEQQMIFKAALSSMHIWYLSHDTMVWLLTKTPKDVRPYCDRGWTTFENGVASMVTAGSNLLDLGKLTRDMKSWLVVSKRCRAGRQPPLAPDVFVNLLKQKTFTNGSDFSAVAKLYEASFKEAMANADTLHFLDVEWSDDEITCLAQTLPHCKKLQELDISGNALGRQAAEALAAVLPQCHNLKELKLHHCCIGEAGILALAPAFPQMASLRWIVLTSNGLGPRGVKALAEALGGCPNLRNCDLSSNRLSPDKDNIAVPALCAAIRQSSESWMTFYLERNGLNDEEQAAIRSAWAEAGKPSAFCFCCRQELRSTSLGISEAARLLLSTRAAIDKLWWSARA